MRIDYIALVLIGTSMVTSREISFLLLVFVNVLYFLKGIKINKQLIYFLGPLFLLSALGLLASLLYHFNTFKVFKDLAYFLWPILLASSAYFIFRNKTQKFLNTIIVWAAILNGTTYIIRLLYNFDQLPMLLASGSVQQFREVFGSVSGLVPYALFLMFFFKYPLKRSFRLILSVFLSICIILSLSRSILIFLFLLFLAQKQYLDVRNKKITAFIVILIGAFVLLPLSTKFFPKESIIGNFVNKTANSLTEISSKSDYSTLSSINRNWRGYEVHQLKKHLKSLNNSFIYVTGEGLGSEVDLELDITLGGTLMHKIPHLHNGYMYLLLKTGIIGILVYLIFHLRLYKASYRTQNSFVRTNIQFWVFYSLYASLVITGMFNFSRYYIFVIVGLLAANKLIENPKKKPVVNPHLDSTQI